MSRRGGEAGLVGLLLDGWLPPRVGRNARLERLTQLIDWAPLEALVAEFDAAPVSRPSYPPLLMVKVLLMRQWYQASSRIRVEEGWRDQGKGTVKGLAGTKHDSPDSQMSRVVS